MSSPIHAARCAKRDATSVDVQLTPTPASGAQFPFSRFFGLWLLHEAATSVVYRGGTPRWRSGAPAGALAGALEYDELAGLTDTETPDEQLIRPPSPPSAAPGSSASASSSIASSRASATATSGTGSR